MAGKAAKPKAATRQASYQALQVLSPGFAGGSLGAVKSRDRGWRRLAQLLQQGFTEAHPLRDVPHPQRCRRRPEEQQRSDSA